MSLSPSTLDQSRASECLAITLAVLALIILPVDWSEWRSKSRTGLRIKSLVIAAALVGWPVLAFSLREDHGIVLATVLLYAIIAKLTGHWAPVVGLMFGGVFAFVFLSIGSADVADRYALLFACLAVGTIGGTFAAEMKRWDDAEQSRSKS